MKRSLAPISFITSISWRRFSMSRRMVLPITTSTVATRAIDTRTTTRCTKLRMA